MADDMRFNELQRLIDQLVPDIMTRLALQGEGYAKADDPWVDTGFSRNSIQAISAGGEGTEGNSEKLRSPKTGQTSDYNAEPLPAAPDENTSGVGIGADYGLFLELKKPFIAPAVQKLRGTDVQKIVSAVASERGIK